MAGLAIGYALGTRAGRERYDQLRNTVDKMRENPTVQEAVGVVQAQVGRVMSSGKDAVGERLSAGRLGQTRIGERLLGATADRQSAAPGAISREPDTGW